MKGNKIWFVVLFILVLGIMVFCLNQRGKQDSVAIGEKDKALLEVQEKRESLTSVPTVQPEEMDVVPTTKPKEQTIPELAVDLESLLHEMEVPLGKLLRMVYFNVIPEEGAMGVLEEVTPYLSETCKEYYKGYVDCILYENELPEFYPEEEGEYVWLWDEEGEWVVGALPLREYEIQYGDAPQADIFTVDAPRKEDEIDLAYSVAEDREQILVDAVDKEQGERKRFRVVVNTGGLIDQVYVYGGVSDEQK